MNDSESVVVAGIINLENGEIVQSTCDSKEKIAMRDYCRVVLNEGRPCHKDQTFVFFGFSHMFHSLSSKSFNYYNKAKNTDLSTFKILAYKYKVNEKEKSLIEAKDKLKTFEDESNNFLESIELHECLYDCVTDCIEEEERVLNYSIERIKCDLKLLKDKLKELES